LLDEPFSSLDTKLRESTRTELRTMQQEIGFTAILVTHDQSEALSISDRIAVMRAGRLDQYAPPLDIYYRPATRFVADFVGRANPVPGGIVRPEFIRLLDAGASEGVPGRVISAAFHGSGSEIVVEIADGTQIAVAADGTAPQRHGPKSPVRLAWAPENVITFGEEA
jgi:ABC-type Fe3+/spermidine/putrescine transport system ATPase subunit